MCMAGTGGRRGGGFAGRGGATETAGLAEVLKLVVLAAALSDCRDPLEGMLAVDVDGTEVPLLVLDAVETRTDETVPVDQSLCYLSTLFLSVLYQNWFQIGDRRCNLKTIRILIHVGKPRHFDLRYSFLISK